MTDIVMKKTEKIFYFTMVVLLFQITRNISTVAYVGILFASYALLYIFFLYERSRIRNVEPIRFRPIEIIFILSLIWIPIISIAYLDMNKYILAFARYFVTFPFILFCIIYKNYSYSLIHKTLRFLCVFMAVASLSIPYQIIFGPISFFADFSYREGFERYSSLAGSLTALGTLGALALAILLFSGKFLFSNKTKSTLVIIIIAGMLLSFQKAAVANIIICFGAYILLNGNINIFKRVFSAIGFVILLSVFYLLIMETEFASYIQGLIQYSLSGKELGIEQDLLVRLWERPNRVIDYNSMGFFNYIVGIGFASLGGIMGLPEMPMSHNNYFDLIFSGGLIHLLSFLLIMAIIPISVLVKKVKGVKLNIIDRSYSMVILLILINMAIGAGSFYQPINSIFIFFIIFSYSSASNLINNNKELG